jgi:hypothetical protein
MSVNPVTFVAQRASPLTFRSIRYFLGHEASSAALWFRRLAFSELETAKTPIVM